MKSLVFRNFTFHICVQGFADTDKLYYSAREKCIQITKKERNNLNDSNDSGSVHAWTNNFTRIK